MAGKAIRILLDQRDTLKLEELELTKKLSEKSTEYRILLKQTDNMRRKLISLEMKYSLIKEELKRKKEKRLKNSSSAMRMEPVKMKNVIHQSSRDCDEENNSADKSSIRIHNAKDADKENVSVAEKRVVLNGYSLRKVPNCQAGENQINQEKTIESIGTTENGLQSERSLRAKKPKSLKEPSLKTKMWRPT